MYYLTQELYFPPVETASPEGIVAVGGRFISRTTCFGL